MLTKTSSLELLGNVDQDMSLENVIKYIEVKDAGKRSASLLQQHSETAAASTYSRNKKRQAITCVPELSNKRQEAKCIFCGKCGHGLSPKLEQRRKHCPAYGNECKICNKLNHFENVCRSSDKPLECNKAVTNDINANDTIFTSLCMIQSKNNYNKLGHHVYDPSSDAWLNHAFQPQPTIQLQANLHPDDYSSLGYQLPSYNQSVTVTALADTGCQCCLAGTNLLQHLNLRNDDLIPTKMVMNAANNKSINILGAVVVRLKSLNNLQNTTETRQMIYITTDTDRMFLSREALGIIQKDFPHITLTDSKSITGRSSLAQQANHSACDRQPQYLPPSSSTKPSCVPPLENGLMLEHLNPMHPLQSPQRYLKMSERLSEHTRSLPPLKVGDHVRIENQTNNYLTKWDRTGRVVKVKQYHQYLIRVDGSGRIKMKNRKFLRKFTPPIPDQKPYPLTTLLSATEPGCQIYPIELCSMNNQ